MRVAVAGSQLPMMAGLSQVGGFPDPHQGLSHPHGAEAGLGGGCSGALCRVHRWAVPGGSTLTAVGSSAASLIFPSLSTSPW